MIYSLNEKVETHARLDVHKSICIDDEDFVSFVSGNAFESLATTNPEYFNEAALKAIRDGDNIVEEFNKYLAAIISGEMEKVKVMSDVDRDNDTSLAAMNIFIINVLMADFRLLKEEIGEEEAKRAIIDMYIPQSLTEEGCKRLINIRLSNSRFLADCITKMLKYNYFELGISAAEAKKLTDMIEDDALSYKGYAKIKEIMNNPKVLERYRMKGNRNNYDFRSIGGACVFLSADSSIQNAEIPAKHLLRIFKYDAIVVAHGGHDTDMRGNPFKYIKDGKSRDWFMQPVSTFTKKDITTVVDIVRVLKKEGFKNVYIGCCNPGHVMLPKDIIDDPDFKVTIGLDSVLMEDTSLISVNEGLLSNIKEYFKNGAIALNKLIKGTISRMKFTVNNMSSFVKNKFGSKALMSLPKPVSIGCMYMDNNKAHFKIETATTPYELQVIANEANKSLVNYMNKLAADEYKHIDALYRKAKLNEAASKPAKNGEGIFESLSMLGRDNKQSNIVYSESMFIDETFMNMT